MKTPSFNHKSALSIIEIMIAIFIFTLGISAIFMVITSTLNINTYNKNYIIASNLAREQIELVRNIRDTNYEKFQKWDTRYPDGGDYTKTFEAGKFYTIDNNLSTGFPVTISNPQVPIDIEDALKDVTNTAEEAYRVCIDSNMQYSTCTYPLLTGVSKTSFYKYIEIQEVKESLASGAPIVTNALKIHSKVYWNQKGVHDTEISTIITDWKRL